MHVCKRESIESHEIGCGLTMLCTLYVVAEGVRRREEIQEAAMFTGIQSTNSLGIEGNA